MKLIYTQNLTEEDYEFNHNTGGYYIKIPKELYLFGLENVTFELFINKIPYNKNRTKLTILDSKRNYIKTISNKYTHIEYY